MKLHNWSSDNIAFGSGGGLLQEVNKDTLKCVYKCSYAVVNGKGVCCNSCIIEINLAPIATQLDTSGF